MAPQPWRLSFVMESLWLLTPEHQLENTSVSIHTALKCVNTSLIASWFYNYILVHVTVVNIMSICIYLPYNDVSPNVLQHQRRPIKWLRSTLTCWAPCPAALQTVSTGRDCWLKSAGLSQHASEGMNICSQDEVTSLCSAVSENVLSNQCISKDLKG